MIQPAIRALLNLMEITADGWADSARPEALRLSEPIMRHLLDVQVLARDGSAEVTSDLIRQHAPTFVDQYEQVMMRPFV